MAMSLAFSDQDLGLFEARLCTDGKVAGPRNAAFFVEGWRIRGQILASFGGAALRAAALTLCESGLARPT
jgi:hypothetical protein